MAFSHLFSSFAISVAANIVTSLFARNSTEKDIRAAFQDAIEKWCPNEDIRRFREPAINKFVEDYIIDPTLDPETLSDEMNSFLSCFEECVAAHEAAFHYLSAIKEKSYYSEVMATLQIVNRKLDVISEKLDATDPRHEELHFEAVAEINTVIEEVVVEPVNAFLFGIEASFDEGAYVYIENTKEGNVRVIMDKDSYLDNDEVNPNRKKYHDFEYDWDKEPNKSWAYIVPDFHFWQLFHEANIAGFQLMGIDFYDSIEKLEACVDKMSINQQLTVDERRIIANMKQAMRALQAMIEDHGDIFTKVNAKFENIVVEKGHNFRRDGLEIGTYQIVYKVEDYEESITGILTLPIAYEDNLLDMWRINEDYYFKFTGYLGMVFNCVKEWWEVSNDDARK